MKLKTMTGAMLGSAAATDSMTAAAGATGSYVNDAMSSTDPAAAADALGLGTIAASATTG